MVKKTKNDFVPLSNFFDYSKDSEWDATEEKTLKGLQLEARKPFSEETGRMLLNNLYKIFYVITAFSIALISRSFFIINDSKSNITFGIISFEQNWVLILIALIVFIVPICFYFYYFHKMMKRVFI